MEDIVPGKKLLLLTFPLEGLCINKTNIRKQVKDNNRNCLQKKGGIINLIPKEQKCDKTQQMSLSKTLK